MSPIPQFNGRPLHELNKINVFISAPMNCMALRGIAEDEFKKASSVYRTQPGLMRFHVYSWGDSSSPGKRQKDTFEEIKEDAFSVWGSDQCHLLLSLYSNHPGDISTEEFDYFSNLALPPEIWVHRHASECSQDQLNELNKWENDRNIPNGYRPIGERHGQISKKYVFTSGLGWSIRNIFADSDLD